MNSIQRTPYENIAIGHFLYGLGLSLGTNAGKNTPQGNISNTQQTPLDPILADVWLTFPGISRLFEFKRKEANREKDNLKNSALNTMLEDQPALIPISRQIHWFVEISMDEVNGPSLAMSPYIDFNTGKAQHLSMSQYIAKLTAQAIKPPPNEPSRDDVAAYLQVVGQLAEDSSTASGGLLVNIQEDGTLKYFPLSDIRDLGLYRSEFIAREHQQTLALELTREKAVELSLEQPKHNPRMGR